MKPQTVLKKRSRKSYSQAQSQRTGCLQQPRHQPRNLHHLHQARRPLNHSESGSAEECSAYSQHDRFSNHRSKLGYQLRLIATAPKSRNRQTTHLLVVIFGVDVTQCTLAHILSISLHFVPPVRWRHDRIVWTIIWGRSMLENNPVEKTDYLVCNSPSRSLRKARFMPVMVSAINAACAVIFMVSVTRLSG